MSDAKARPTSTSCAIDCYAEAESIAKILANEGHVEAAESLIDAVASGSTASEILMALQFRLAALDLDGVLKSEFAISRVRRLIAALNSLVGQTNR